MENMMQQLQGYTELQEKEEWPIWNVKIAEIYSVKGDFVKSNEIIENVYETRNKIIDTKKEEIRRHLKLKIEN